MTFSGLKSTLRKKSFQIHVLFSVDALFLVYAAFFFFFDTNMEAIINY